jgi:hypothetical protein
MNARDTEIKDRDAAIPRTLHLHISPSHIKSLVSSTTPPTKHFPMGDTTSIPPTYPLVEH